MKVLLVIALVAATFWVWSHHTATATSFCVTEPAQVCVEHSTTTTRSLRDD
jgi:hypothetical protein